MKYETLGILLDGENSVSWRLHEETLKGHFKIQLYLKLHTSVEWRPLRHQHSSLELHLFRVSTGAVSSIIFDVQTITEMVMEHFCNLLHIIIAQPLMQW